MEQEADVVEEDEKFSVNQTSTETEGPSAVPNVVSKILQQQHSDSDEDILLIVEEKKEEKQKRPKNVVRRSQAKNSEVFRLAQEQARLRRIQEEEDLNHLIEEQKRKKAARKAARKPETDSTTDSVDAVAEAETADAPKTLKRLMKVSQVFFVLRPNLTFY